ncbi:hypothetical protein K2X05_00690 [bacterium]|nr:hypothetical protein [bacterium]
MLSLKGDNSSSSIGGEVRYFKLETQLGKPHLFVLDSMNHACRVPIELFKELGIDPIQFGMSLRNIKETDGIILTCYITTEEMGKRFFAYKIEVTSWPRP